MAPTKGTTSADLSRGQWLFAFLLVTMLFFTWGFAYGLLDVLNKHFQVIFGINKLQSTLLQLAYFGSYFVWPPFAGMFMRKYGYKVVFGRSYPERRLLSASIERDPSWLDAILTWCRVLLAFCGLPEIRGIRWLHVLHRHRSVHIGRYAAARLNFSQGFQGVASFAGPMIASRWFFTGANAYSLDTVQWVYLAVAVFGLLLNVTFFFCPLPEITEDALSAELLSAGIQADEKPFWQQWHCIFGFVAQTAYVGAQVAVASLVVNYLTDPTQGSNLNDSTASQLFSYCQITFTVGRFVSVVLLRYIDPALMLSFHALACSVFSIAVALAKGQAGIVCLFCLFYFESLAYPVIFTLGTKNLGRHTKRGSSLIVMGVGGGAWYPPAQAALADLAGTPRSYLVPASGYLAMLLYGVGMVIDQSMKIGFHFRNVDELAATRAIVANAVTPTELINPTSDMEQTDGLRKRASNDVEKNDAQFIE